MIPLWYLLGTLYSQANRPTEAIEALTKATDVNPEHPYAWFNLSNIYGKQSLFEKQAHRFWPSKNERMKGGTRAAATALRSNDT